MLPFIDHTVHVVRHYFPSPASLFRHSFVISRVINTCKKSQKLFGRAQLPTKIGGRGGGVLQILDR
jgi:hypothetical protein